MKEKKFIKLTPFKMQVLQSFPFIDEDFDAITNYELLCKVVDYLNKTVENVDYLNDTVNDYIDKFNELKSYVDNYFDNLDVQEEINNKLDEMAESGQLTDIIAQYLGLAGVLVYNTVNDMRNATNLVDGSICRTLGYYSLNDGGGALYKIKSTLPTSYYETLNNLYAELILNEEMNVLQFGAIGDGTTDDTQKIQNALNTKKKIIIPKTDYSYLITEHLFVYNDIVFKSYIKMYNTDGSRNTACIIVNNYQNDKQLNIINPLIDGNRDITQSYIANDTEYSHGIAIEGSKNINIVGGFIKNCHGDSIAITSSNENRHSKNINITDTKCDYPFRNCISIISGVDVNVKNCEMYNRNGYSNTLVEPNPDDSLQNKNITFDGGYYYANSSAGVMQSYSARTIENLTYKNLIIDVDSGCSCCIRLATPNNPTYFLDSVLIENVKVINPNRQNMQLIANLGTSGKININNFKINNKFDSLSFTCKNLIIDKMEIFVSSDLTSGSINIFAENISIVNSLFNSRCVQGSGYGLFNIYKGKEILIDNNTFLNNKNSVSIGSQSASTPDTFDNVIMTNNIVSSDSSDSHGLVVFRNGIINNLILTDNIEGSNINTFMWNINGTINKANGNNLIKGKIFYGTAIPVSGTYNKGDIIINTNPASGSPIGWICTASGTSGTWNIISNIQ